ncbi:dephospho-CoA kinase [Lyngbya sp. PCC 8106]|uniref:dephospho-CoA kinase n=1 Tax=Lyngbya sp. (strain PCC 8106) TaxID=313612 RepID=UPI0000EAC87D|nr:dephospho-CoA kinase [Lyngbya sp. PCC 8106]EAW34678.1 Dephospho-CoA kinase [Lyngbya sp. PCC 8106]
MRLIGLTGGISTGKTTVSNYLAEMYPFPIWDADVYSREAVQPNSPVLQTLVRRYGTGILLSDGSLNRQQLGTIIFSSLTERHWVEQQIHPVVRDRFCENIQQLRDQEGKDATAILVIPLLFEAKMTDLVTEIWVISCSPQQQQLRLIQRSNGSLTPEQAQARIDSQMPLEQKCKMADVVLDNSSTLEELWQQVDDAIARKS